MAHEPGWVCASIRIDHSSGAEGIRCRCNLCGDVTWCWVIAGHQARVWQPTTGACVESTGEQREEVIRCYDSFPHRTLRAL
jgi:hypothetical protein